MRCSYFASRLGWVQSVAMDFPVKFIFQSSCLMVVIKYRKTYQFLPTDIRKARQSPLLNFKQNQQIGYPLFGFNSIRLQYFEILMETSAPSGNSFSLILPSNRVPVALSHLTRPLTDKFLVRYRNILVESEGGITWGLVKDSNFCGKAFAHNIQLIKQAGEMIEVVGQNYILLKIEKQVQRPAHPLTEEQVRQLLQEIGGNNKINISLLKNAFDTYEQYAETAEKAVAFVGLKEMEKEVNVAEKVQLQFNAKRLSGKALLEVPKIIKQTGNWSQDQNVELKLANN